MADTITASIISGPAQPGSHNDLTAWPGSKLPLLGMNLREQQEHLKGEYDCRFGSSELELEISVATTTKLSIPTEDDEEEIGINKRNKKPMKKSIVDHTYRDYSHMAIDDLVDNFNNRRINENLFPAKLHKMLSTPEYGRIIIWKPHGRAWAVVDKTLFVSIVLPKYFNHGNFESFNRSVNGWGFKRLVGEGPDQNSYYHELFMRGLPELTRAMTRLVTPGKRLPNKEGEPNFYEISRKYPLPDTLASASHPFIGRVKEDEIDRGTATSTAQHHPPLFTPLATKRHKCSHFTHQGTHHQHQHPYYGYHPHPPYATATVPHSEPPPYSQHPSYSRPLPHYSQPPPNYAAPPYGAYHTPPGHFYHQPSRDTEMPPRGPPMSAPFHPQSWGPASMPPQEWHSSYPHNYYHHYQPSPPPPPPAAQPTAQHDDEFSPGRILPILHTNHKIGYPGQISHVALMTTNQNGYNTNPGGWAAQNTGHAVTEEKKKDELDERSPAAQDTIRQERYHGTSNYAINPPTLEGSPSQLVEGLKLRSDRLNTWQRDKEEEPFDQCPSSIASAKEQSIAHDDAYIASEANAHNASLVHHFQSRTHDAFHSASKADTYSPSEAGEILGLEEGHNPLDIDNFYGPPSSKDNKTD